MSSMKRKVSKNQKINHSVEGIRELANDVRVLDQREYFIIEFLKWKGILNEEEFSQYLDETYGSKLEEFKEEIKDSDGKDDLIKQREKQYKTSKENVINAFFTE